MRSKKEENCSVAKDAAKEISISEAERLWEKGRVSLGVNDGRDVVVDIEEIKEKPKWSQETERVFSYGEISLCRCTYLHLIGFNVEADADEKKVYISFW